MPLDGSGNQERSGNVHFRLSGGSQVRYGLAVIEMTTAGGLCGFWNLVTGVVLVARLAIAGRYAMQIRRPGEGGGEQANQTDNRNRNAHEMGQ